MYCHCSARQAKKGLRCTGTVTKVGSFGIHVTFYGNVFGVIPAKSMVKHGIQDPSEAFNLGQVRGITPGMLCGSSTRGSLRKEPTTAAWTW